METEKQAEQLVPLSLQVPKSLKDWLHEVSRQADRSINWVANRALESARSQGAQQ